MTATLPNLEASPSAESGFLDLTGEGDSAALAGRIRSAAWDMTLAVFYLGRRPYRPIWALQKQLHTWRLAGEIPDTILLLEHEPVYTVGKNADGRNLLAIRPADAEVVTVDRGGDVTYHGPGQLVGYPIINLRQHETSVSWYMRGLEGAIIDMLAALDVEGVAIEGLTGVWVHHRKIAALGVRLSHWITTHGFAVNIDVPNRYFDGIVPCGILEYGVGNLNSHLPRPVTVIEVAGMMTPALRRFLEA